MRHTWSVYGRRSEGLARWEVHRWLVLGHFAFGRFAMYADLNPENRTTHPAEHVLVSSILRGAEASGEGGFLPSIPEDYPIDDPEIEKFAPLLIQDADASQHSALVDVMREKNLVIQGPPGTGKSQTITNILANALAADKKVLFLAEKQAALEVVKRRLTRAGLGDFCLELHSDKSSPRLVIENLKQRAEISSSGTKSQTKLLPILLGTKSEGDRSLFRALHAEQPDGMTTFQLIWKALRGQTANTDIIDNFKSVALPEELLSMCEHARPSKKSRDFRRYQYQLCQILWASGWFALGGDKPRRHYRLSGRAPYRDAQGCPIWKPGNRGVHRECS